MAEAELTLPAWINGSAQMSALDIHMTATAQRQLAAFVAASKLTFYTRDELPLVTQALVDCLSLDPRTQHAKEKHQAGAMYRFRFDTLEAVFRMTGPAAAEVWRVRRVSCVGNQRLAPFCDDSVGCGGG